MRQIPFISSVHILLCNKFQYIHRSVSVFSSIWYLCTLCFGAVHICPLHMRSSETTSRFKPKHVSHILYAPIHNRATPYINTPRTSPLFFAGSIRTGYRVFSSNLVPRVLSLLDVEKGPWEWGFPLAVLLTFAALLCPISWVSAFFWSEARFDLIALLHTFLFVFNLDHLQFVRTSELDQLLHKCTAFSAGSRAESYLWPIWPYRSAFQRLTIWLMGVASVRIGRSGRPVLTNDDKWLVSFRLTSNVELRRSRT